MSSWQPAAIVVVAILCACEPAAPAVSAPAVDVRGSLNAVSEREAAARLLHTLEMLDPEQCVYLAGIGWLQLKRYERYKGRNPRSGQAIDVPAKYGVFFISDPELARELDGQPLRNKEFARELDRFFDAIHGDDPSFDPASEDPRITIARYDWSEALAAAVRRELVSRGVAEIPAVGTFDVIPRPAYRTGSGSSRTIRFTGADELRWRLDARSVVSGATN